MPAWLDPDRDTLDRSAFSDPAIHALELDRLFVPSWLFAGPANWLAQPGDWIAARLGAEPIVVWRDGAGTLQGFVDPCPRCQRSLSPGERGSATTIGCPRHPPAAPARVPQIAEHHGLVFATLDPNALPLPERTALVPEPMIAVGEHRLRWTFAGNWKLAMEHFCGAIDSGDWIHAASELPRRTAATLFPNMTFDPATSSLQVWHPVAPDRTDVDTWCMVPAEATAEQRDAARRATTRAWGPGGLLAQDLAPHWQSVTQTSKGALARRYPLPLRQESGQRAFYTWWHHRLTAANTRLRHSMPLHLRAG
ncbi:aromatic ring-hydroxylating dioxygenase subunit alpha [Reyranella sp.]|uniref:aromatic ring-hydroxylating dioxygenase subunit alpha n=1 Tax=Reyranella sp. TaxID=1929291 RepID=UPI003782E98D